jgi:general secretion pathway protein D
MKRMLLVFLVVAAGVSARQLFASPAAGTESAPAAGAGSVPPDPVSEVIPIKYALAADIAAVLNGSNSDSKAAASNRLNERVQYTLDAKAVREEIEGLGPRKVIGDERSNALLVYASAPAQVRIKAIIAKLDVALAQVLVEVAAVQLPPPRAKIFPWPAAEPIGMADGRIIPSLLAGLTVVSTTSFVPDDAATGAVGRTDGFTYAAMLRGDLDDALRAVATNRDIKLLQRPRIQTPVGAPVDVFVGSPPAPPSSYPFTGGACSCGSWMSMLRTGVTAEVTSVLMANNLILVGLEEAIDSVTGVVTITNVGEVPVTSRRTAQTGLTIRDGETIALAGYIETQITPLFSEVAQLKRFGRVGDFLNRLITFPKRRSRHELAILLRPTVLSSPGATNWFATVR